jgi:iron complex outermembrane receptor protein
MHSSRQARFGRRIIINGCAVALALHAMAAAAGGTDDITRKPRVTQLKGVDVRALASPVATQARVGTKTDTPLIETPQSVTVIGRDELTVRAVHSLSDALNYTAGTTANATGTDARYDWPYIRGFSAGDFGIYLDGLRYQPGSFVGRIEPYLLDSVAILKGPSSVLYGENSPGGLIDASSKRPTAEPLHELGVQLGNYGLRQLQGDFGGPLDEAGHWLYRLTAVTHDNDSQIDHVYDRRAAVAPALTWRPSDDTRLTLLAHYQRDLTNSLFPFLPAQGTVLYNPNGRLPTSLFTGDPDYDSYRRTSYGLGYQLEHRIDDVWTIRQNARVERMEVDWRQLYASSQPYSPGTLLPDYATFGRLATHTTGWTNNYAVDTQAQARFETGELKHTVLLGLDVDYNPAYQNEFGNIGRPLDAYAPVYNQPVPPLALHALEVHQTLKQTGVYAQDQVKVGKHWVALLGVRHDWAGNSTHNLLGGTQSNVDGEKTTGRAGLVYLTSFGLAPYVSWSTSFLPNTGTDFQGRAFAPTTGRQVEGGFKYQPRDVDAYLTVSAFDLHQSNVLVTDPSHPQFSTPAGEVRSRGAEFEGVANLSFGLQLRAAYTYDQVETVHSTDPSQIGLPPTTVPMHTASLWADYSVQGGAAQGLGFGAGVRRTGKTYGGTYHPDVTVPAVVRNFNVPAFTLVDAELHYQWDGVRLALNADNLFDRHYVTACYGELGCSWGLRRTVMASATYRW